MLDERIELAVLRAVLTCYSGKKDCPVLLLLSRVAVLIKFVLPDKMYRYIGKGRRIGANTLQ